jgi:glycyl-tRNA synthetase beta chain
MPNYLLEIGTEELPADHVPEAQSRLKTLLSDALRQANVPFESITALGTPRRLSCIVRGLAPLQDTIKKKIKGPPVKSSFDSSGKPLPPANGFAQKQGLSVDQLGREEMGGVEYLIADLVIKGKPSAEVLREIVPPAIMQLSGERLMRWGNSDLKFSRPIRWLVSILDNDELDIQLDGIKSGRDSFGNRVLAPEKLRIENSETYVDSLRKAKVLVDPEERRALVQKQVFDAAASVQGKARKLEGPLLDEVTNILEWPHALIGEFAPDYLKLPEVLIETIMVHHQRYFPVERDDGSGRHGLLPYFIAVANNDRAEAESHIKKGNERVIKARLADGKFFFFDDQKTRLMDRRPALDQLTFQEGLGSYLRKTDRLCYAARYLSSALMLEARYLLCIEQSLLLCKLDLVSNLVRELPELQGYVGAWYAAREGESLEVVEAIANHYAPRSQDDPIPADTVGRFAALVDKLDNLVGLFALGRRPSGSSDPYALRRQAYGLVDILMEGLNEYHLNLSELMALLMEQIKPLLVNKRGFDPDKALTDLSEFLMQRVRTKMLDKGYRREVIEAVCAGGHVLCDIPDALTRCRAIEDLINSDPELVLIRAGVRVGKILADDSSGVVDEKLFEADAERELFKAFSQKILGQWDESRCTQALTSVDYAELLELLAGLAAPVEKFFDDVMVDDPDRSKRNNRHALLSNINRYFSVIGDFRCLKPLLP